jgi:hypothetical protein
MRIYFVIFPPWENCSAVTEHLHSSNYSCLFYSPFHRVCTLSAAQQICFDAVQRPDTPREEGNAAEYRPTEHNKINCMKSAVFWIVAPCSTERVGRFGGTYRLNLQGRRANSPCHLILVSYLSSTSTLQMEAIFSAETSGSVRIIRRYNPEDRAVRVPGVRTSTQKFFEISGYRGGEGLYCSLAGYQTPYSRKRLVALLRNIMSPSSG